MNSRNFKRRITEMNGCFYGEIVWESTTQIKILPKTFSGHKWIGAILNNDRYLETNSPITIDITTDELSGMGQQLDQFYIIYAYDNAGSLDFGLSWMPKASLTSDTHGADGIYDLKQINSTNPGNAFNSNSNVVVWDSATKFTTPIYENSDGSGSLDYTLDYAISTVAATSITLNSNVTTAYAEDDIIYQIDNFEPRSIIDNSLVVSNYLDIGWRIRTNATGSGEIIPFYISGDYMIYEAPSADWVGFSETEGAIGRLLYASPDTKEVRMIVSVHDAPSDFITGYKLYYQTYTNRIAEAGGGTAFGHNIFIPILHGLIFVDCDTSYGYGVQGYKRCA